MSEIKITKNEEGYWLEYDDKFDGPYEVIEDAEHERDTIEVWNEVDYNLGLGKERHGD